MLVGARMTYPVITIGPRASLESAKEIIDQESISTLPVVDRQGRFLGLVTKDIIEEKISFATRTQEHRPALLIEDVMLSEALTVTENTPIEEAARIISDYDIESLPVLRGNYVVGIITASSLIRILLEITGARSQGIRLTAVVEDSPGKFIAMLQKIWDLNGNISSFTTYYADEKDYRVITVKVSGIEKYELKQAIASLVHKVIDVR